MSEAELEEDMDPQRDAASQLFNLTHTLQHRIEVLEAVAKALLLRPQ